MGSSYVGSIPCATSSLSNALIHGIFTDIYLYDLDIRIPCRCCSTRRRSLRLANKSYLGGIISLLLGLTIGFTLLTFLYTLVTYFSQGILEAFFFAFLYMLPGILIIVLLEFILLSYAKFDEQKRQTQLLEQILQELKTSKKTNYVITPLGEYT